MAGTEIGSISALNDLTYNTFMQGEQIELANHDALPFRHERLIGQGSSAAIVMVSHKVTNERYALKTFRRYRGRRFESFKRTAENEISIMKRLSSHTHIIQVLGSYICHRELSIVLSPAASHGDLGAYLTRILESGMASDEENVLSRAFGCLASGLAYMHKHTIRHKDIKPQNILIHHGRVVYTDFGLSYDANHQDTTTTGYTNVFTRRYCAPEVRDYTRRNRKSDVYSLGCVFVEIFDVLEPSMGLRWMDEVPYSEKLDEVRRCLSHASVTERAKKSLLLICHDMLEPKNADRMDADSVLRRLSGLGSVYNSRTGLFCEDCSITAGCTDVWTQEQLVENTTTLSLTPSLTDENRSSEPEIESSATKAAKKRKSKGIVSIAVPIEENRSPIYQRPFSSGILRYYCTTCGELGHDSFKCPNQCWACGGLYHQSSNCPNKCWNCDCVGHYARDCPNKCDACGKTGHSKDDCPHRCWTCGEAGHFARDCEDECFVCGRLGHGTQKCKGKCHKCGKIGHWKRDCAEACFACGELGHWVAQCPSRRKKRRRSGARY